MGVGGRGGEDGAEGAKGSKVKYSSSLDGGFVGGWDVVGG